MPRISNCLSVGLAALVAFTACSELDPPPSQPRTAPQPSAASYVTSASCQHCHEDAFRSWSGSHHDRAMEDATDKAVLGDFRQARFEHFGTTWEFVRDAERFMVRIEEPDAKQTKLEILYTFGFEPLQQYLVKLQDGRLQALTTAWDSRPAEEGGQRWFSLHPDHPTPPGDVLHWNGVANRWNSMCADCHSTGIEKNFNPEGQRYQTTWAEVDVACEACHGPGSNHVTWAEAGAHPESPNGLPVDLSQADDARWVMNADSGIARRDPPRTEQREIETCAPCHSRRSRIHDGDDGGKFLDHYRPALLEEGLYFSDGQIHDEVYVYGSFLQSKMYRAGVSCSDCHDAHSLKLRAPGDSLCATCHSPDRFATPSHHHHAQESPAARCVSCHMPERTYMEVDDRRDHSFRIPRPDLSDELGTPNPCSACHGERGTTWAAEAIDTWSPQASERPTYAQALGRGQQRGMDAPRVLRDLARLARAPGIARATAVAFLARYPGPASADAIAFAAQDVDPLVRSAAARAAESLPTSERAGRIGSLLDDALRSVRIEAARALAGAPSEQLSNQQRAARKSALAEYRNAQEINADDPSAHVNLGLLELSMGRAEKAEVAYRRAIAIGPYFIPAFVNLADLYGQQGRLAESEALLREALQVAPDSAEVRHALGLVLVRLERNAEALAELQQAADLAPGSARFAYVYGVALHSFGETARAISTLDGAHLRHPAEPSILQALVAILRDGGQLEQAAQYAARLEALIEGERSSPDKPRPSR